MPPEYFFPMLGMAFALGWGVLGTVRWYAKQKLRAQLRPAAGAQEERLEQLEGRVAELEERLDFAERVLARGRDANRLPGG
jgi:hypothetical protein